MALLVLVGLNICILVWTEASPAVIMGKAKKLGFEWATPGLPEGWET